MGLLGNPIVTILNHASVLKDDLRLTSHSVFKLHSYVEKSDRINLTPSGKMKVKLPDHSNIHKLDKILKKICKTIPNCDVLVSNEDGAYVEKYTDNFGRFMASKVVDNYGQSYYLRGDIATQITHQGNMLIQCDRSSCSVFIPNQMSVDFKNFSPKRVEGKVNGT